MEKGDVPGEIKKIMVRYTVTFVMKHLGSYMSLLVFPKLSSLQSSADVRKSSQNRQKDGLHALECLSYQDESGLTMLRKTFHAIVYFGLTIV